MEIATWENLVSVCHRISSRFVVVVAVVVVVVVAAVVVVVVVSCRKVSALMNNFPIGWTSTGNQSRRKERRRKEAKGKGAKRKCHNHGFRGKEGVRGRKGGGKERRSKKKMP